MALPSDPVDLAAANTQLCDVSAPTVVQWATEAFGDGLVMTSSFGVQAAVTLHLVTRILPDIPVIFIDTGFHFPETYLFTEQLTDRLKLNLKVYQATLSPARMVAHHGMLWEQGIEGLNRYDRIRKIEPMQKALTELAATAWVAGLRQEQTEHRQSLQHITIQDGIYKIHPIITWTTQDVHQYLKDNDLPYHPLYDQGYTSIGDWHSTFPVGENEQTRQGRFHGLKQECGIHLPQTPEEGASRDASML